MKRRQHNQGLGTPAPTQRPRTHSRHRPKEEPESPDDAPPTDRRRGTNHHPTAARCSAARCSATRCSTARGSAARDSAARCSADVTVEDGGMNELASARGLGLE